MIKRQQLLLAQAKEYLAPLKATELEDVFEPVLSAAREKAEDDCRSSSSVSMDDALNVYKILLLDS